MIFRPNLSVQVKKFGIIMLENCVKLKGENFKGYGGKNQKSKREKRGNGILFPVTVDVTALYTSIPAEGEHGGIQAFEKAMNQRPADNIKQIPTHFLIKLLELVLHGRDPPMEYDFSRYRFFSTISIGIGCRF